MPSKVQQYAKPVIVAAAQSDDHQQPSMTAAVRRVVDNLSPSLDSVVKRGDRVLVKVNMGCTGVRLPEQRYTSHPAYVRAIVECLQDCGARVMFGDDVSRAARYIPQLWSSTGMLDVAGETGAQLVDFIAAGGREVRGFLPYPRTHFITNLVFDADVVVNAANCRSLSDVVLSGAIKNMFGAVLGTRKSLMHALFPDIRDFSRVLVDIFRLIPPRFSFLDMTSVIEGQSVDAKVAPVGLVLGSSDPIALDTVALHAIGYDALTLWTNIYGEQAGLGCADFDRIRVRGIDWQAFDRKSLRHPAPPRIGRGRIAERVTRFFNNTVLRPRPTINPALCTGCGDCFDRCPADAIHAIDQLFAINHVKCADCGCCIKVCEHDAVALDFVGIVKALRKTHRMVRTVQNL